MFSDGIWPPIDQSESILSLRYILSPSGLDLPVFGTYRMRVELTVSTGIVWCVPRIFTVQPAI